MILKEKNIEDYISDTLQEIGYKEIKKDDFFNINNQSIVINWNELKDRLIIINEKIDEKYIDGSINKIKKNLSFLNPINGNKESIIFLKQGIPQKIERISKSTINVKLIDFENLENNSFEFVRQFNVYDGKKIFIPDIVIYINGLPLVIMEIKSPEANEKLNDAYNQVKNYVNDKIDFSHWNIFSIISNGINTKYGDVNSSYSFWWSWKKENINKEIEIDYDPKNDFEKSKNNYKKNILGIFNKKIFTDLIKNYIFYDSNNTKYIPTYYQYFATEKSIYSIINSKYGKGGIVWHTQGSGKSVTMVFIANKIQLLEKKYKIIFLTDRIELDNQLFKRFNEAYEGKYIFHIPKQINSRSEIRNILSNDNDFGIYFTTIQKFTEESQCLTKKDNVIIIVDEAHRSHNNIEIDLLVDKKNLEIIEKSGYAKYIRDAFPNAIFIGFTGTPLMSNDKKTIDVFGNYIDKYTMNQSILDGSTVPIHYEKRKIPIDYNDSRISEIDELYNYLRNEEESQYIDNAKQEYIKKKLINMKNLLSNEKVINTIVDDFLTHYEIRKKVLNGKAMFVAFDRKIAFLIYKEILNRKPEWNDILKIVITSSNKDDEELKKVIPDEKQKKIYADEFKKDKSKIKIVIVVDMWLTGFDVPDLDTLYLFKIIKWHNLMQTLARVNRVYKNKEDGLVVDYIGIWKHISDALKQYSGDDSKNNKFDIEDIRNKLLDKNLEIKKTYFDKSSDIEGWTISNMSDKFEYLKKCMEHILKLSNNEKDLFFAKVSHVTRYFKLCSQILDNRNKLESQLFILIKTLIRNENVEESIDLNKTLKKLKNKMSEIISTGSIEVDKIQLYGRKDLAYISSLIEKEIDSIKNNIEISNINTKVIENEIKAEINKFSKVNPLQAKKLSDDLINLIEKYDMDKNIQEYMIKLMEFAKIINEGYEKSDFIGDENLQVFYNILAEDKYMKEKLNSEILREITFKIYNIVHRNYKDSEWVYNKRIQNEVHTKIKLMLRKDYDYPPKYADNPPNLLLEQINNIIRRDVDYFNEDKDEKNNN